MDVIVDNIWASPSTLHLRVHVWGGGRAWRHKYEVSVPLSEVEPSAIAALANLTYEAPSPDDVAQARLF